MAASFTDAELYGRGCATLVASWAEYARACEAAEVRRPARRLWRAGTRWTRPPRATGMPLRDLPVPDPDVEGDCGIYNVATVVRARRRGFATAVAAAQLHHARNRGCETASLRSTPMAERLYAALGFRDLGRFLEYTPPSH